MISEYPITVPINNLGNRYYFI